MKGVQCYELFGGIALKIHTFSFFFVKTLCMLGMLEAVEHEENLLNEVETVGEYTTR